MSTINKKVLFVLLICTFSVFTEWNDPSNYLCEPGETNNPTSLFKLIVDSERPLNDERTLLKASTENIYYMIDNSDFLSYYWKSKHLFYYINNGNQLQIVRFSKSKIL